MHRIAINEVSTFRWSFGEDVARYRVYGFGGIGLWRHKVSDFCEQTIAEQIRRHQLQVSSLQWAGGFTGNEGLTFSEAIEDAEAAIRLASIVHAGCLIVHAGGQAGHTRNHAHRLFTAALREIVPIARDYGVRLAIEPMERPLGRDFTFIHDVATALEICSEFAPHEVGIVFDLFHFGYDRTQRKVLSERPDRIALVQLADRKSLDVCPSRCPLGQGIIPIREWIQHFQNTGYRGLFEIELFGTEFYEVDPFHVLDESARLLSDVFTRGHLGRAAGALNITKDSLNATKQP
jgi:sugar phosphate isomerase/epimerase